LYRNAIVFYFGNHIIGYYTVRNVQCNVYCRMIEIRHVILNYNCSLIIIKYFKIKLGRILDRLGLDRVGFWFIRSWFISSFESSQIRNSSGSDSGSSGFGLGQVQNWYLIVSDFESYRVQISFNFMKKTKSDRVRIRFYHLYDYITYLLLKIISTINVNFINNISIYVCYKITNKKVLMCWIINREIN
jgi:hypothetical protein